MPLVGAWCGALLAASALTVWNQSNVNEKVYTLSVLIIAVVSWLALRWLDRKDEPGSVMLLVLAGYLMVLGSTNHLMSLLPGPALVALILMEKPSVLLNPNLWIRGVAAVLIGLALNFVLPIRSAQQPVINEGEPTCETISGAAIAVYTQGNAGCRALALNLSRDQYLKPPMTVDPRTAAALDPDPRGGWLLGHQFLNYFQYFDWQWARGLGASPIPGGPRLPFTLVFLGLGIWGLAVSLRSRAGHLTYLGVLALSLTVGLVLYLNFKPGYSLAPETVPAAMREVRERDYFFVGSFHFWGFLAGMGLVAAWRWAAGGGLQSKGLALASPILALAFVPLVFNWGWADRSGDYSARDWAYNMLQSVEPYGILFTNGDNDTFPLWYIQEVEGIRQDVTVIVGQYLYTEWYPRQLRHLTSPSRQRPFEDPEGLGLYETPDSMPTRPITTLSDAELAGIGRAQLESDLNVTLRAPEGAAVLQYPGGSILEREHQLALAIIQESLGERPIHFASSGGLVRTLGMDRWAVRQGITSRLRIQTLNEVEGLTRASENTGGGWVDFDLTLTLADEVFLYRGLRSREIWADRATLNIPLHFYFLYMQLADAALQLGREDEVVDRLLDEADTFLVTAEGGTRGTP
jgi:hypothetical protein